MPRKKCYHCKDWISDKDRKTDACWETTETALTQNLPQELLDAWEKLRTLAPEFGKQRIYASHRSIMFSRKTCYFFVRPMKKRLELCFFLGKTVRHRLIKKTHATSRTKVGHLVYVTHPDQVESPLTDWLREAFEFCEPMKDGVDSKAAPILKSKKKIAKVTYSQLIK